MKINPSSPSRRHALKQTLAWGSGLAVACALPSLAAQAEKPADKTAAPRTIDVVAQRFKFTPNEIRIKKGERVVLAIQSLDFVHGMNIPDFNMRADLFPGKTTRIELQPTRSGTFDFLCDNFCGEGHETMHGRFIVSD
jgi:cytochrome c oxidase subunit 2